MAQSTMYNLVSDQGQSSLVQSFHLNLNGWIVRLTVRQKEKENAPDDGSDNGSYEGSYQDTNQGSYQAT